ncbi:MAG: M16 family metallopeptidase, partial [Thermoanaerobaculia bacterium]
MKFAARLVPLALAAVFGTALADAPVRAKVPVVYRKLPNGLKVVLSPDHTAPTVVVGVYYNIGFRIEPRDRTGFAHLFE